MDSFQLFLAFYMFYLLYLKIFTLNVRNHSRRRWWVRPVNLNRDISGYFATTYLKLKEMDQEAFFKHTRMSRELYDMLLNLLEKDLTKHFIRKPIDFECRLALTLSYLSQGVTHQFLAWSFHIGKSTVREIILETCQIIWKILNPLYVSPPTHQDYLNISNGFWSQWNMPHCIGAIDGKYINIKCPPNSGSLYYDHKGSFSIVLLAACDANYCFTYVDVGAYGSQNDGGILAESKFGKALQNNKLPLPTENALPNSQQSFPYYFVGDAAFPLKQNIMRPFPGKLLDQRRSIFNYRLSRARRTIENSFGILVSRWRILLTTINALPDNVEHIVLSTVALHNFIKVNSHDFQSIYCPPRYIDWEDENGVLQLGEWRHEISATLQHVRLGSNNASRSAFQLRDLLSNYFMAECSIPFQYNRI